MDAAGKWSGGRMLSVERTKELIGEPNMSDDEAEALRDSVRAMAEVMFEQWQYEKRKKKESATVTPATS